MTGTCKPNKQEHKSSGPAGAGAVPVGVPAADGRHPAGGAAAAARARVLPLHARAPRRLHCGPVLRSRLALYG